MAYPGSQYRHGHSSGGYGPPGQGPPPGQWAPPGPPPWQQQYPQPSGGPYGQPMGPPPGQSGDYSPGYSSGNNSPYPPAQSSGNWAPPTGPPPQISDNTRPYTGQNNHHPPQNYSQAQGHPSLPQPGPHDPYFQASDCTGTRKALCIGINYVGSSAELKGCHNDAINMQRFLTDRYNYKQDDIVVLLDSPDAGPRQIPTRTNIIAAAQWLVDGAKPNDSLFFHYSGHGGTQKDPTGMEQTGYNETILPLDFRQAGEIIDDELNYVLVRPLPPGCRLTALFDSCHSGTALDLPYVYSTEGKVKDPAYFDKASAMKVGMDYLRGNRAGAAMDLFKMGKQAFGAGSADKKAKETLTFPCDAIQWSGCKDTQTSADSNIGGAATGAMSYAFIRALSENPNQTYQSLLVHIRGILHGQYQQLPQLSSSHPIDTNVPYVQ